MFVKRNNQDLIEKGEYSDPKRTAWQPPFMFGILQPVYGLQSDGTRRFRDSEMSGEPRNPVICSINMQ
jgi:hypothetical protein